MDSKAPTGTIWVCAACGRSTYDRDDGWDESCALNAILCNEKSIVRQNGRVIKAEAIK